MMTDEANNFITAYRQALEDQYTASQESIENQKNLDYATIMSQANKAGALYSNIPARTKTQYETSTYLPAQQQAYTTYQTGLDKLRNNIISYQNKIKSLDEAIADLNAGSLINQNVY